MQLENYSSGQFSRGAPKYKEILWIAISGVLFASWLPGSRWRCFLLRVFGAKVGEGVVIKSHVNIKFPWKLCIADHVWIGERVWIDNLADVSIKSNTCISQSAYLCTGSHDWADMKFGLIAKPIAIGSGCWIGANTTIAPGTEMEEGSVVSIGAIAKGTLRAQTIYGLHGVVKKRPLPRIVPEIGIEKNQAVESVKGSSIV